MLAFYRDVDELETRWIGEDGRILPILTTGFVVFSPTRGCER